MDLYHWRHVLWLPAKRLLPPGVNGTAVMRLLPAIRLNGCCRRQPDIQHVVPSLLSEPVQLTCNLVDYVGAVLVEDHVMSNLTYTPDRPKGFATGAAWKVMARMDPSSVANGSFCSPRFGNEGYEEQMTGYAKAVIA